MVLADGKVAYFSNNVQEALRLYLSSPTSAHTVDLSNHPGRASGEAILQRITIYDENSVPSHSLLPGVNVTVDLKVRPPTRINAPKVSIGANSERGERVFAIGTHIGGTVISSIHGPSTIRVRFRMPPLVPGQYSLDIGFYDRTGTTLDAIYGAAYVDVLKDDYISMIEAHGQYAGHIMVRSEWTSAQDSDERPGESASAYDSFLQGNNS
jgi:hypothetical protein